MKKLYACTYAWACVNTRPYRRMDIQTHGHANTWTHGRTNVQTYGHADRQMDIPRD